ncbi:MAG: amidohydrolase family protein [Candidatus Glassbacteria bacterium]|nr:amidohydrolase family protein [Candidatus Glassbacteria bacterium]
MSIFTVKIPGRDFCWEARLEKGRLAELTRADHTPTDLWLTRGLVDIQVNGYAGVNLTGAGLENDQLAHLEQELLSQGVTRWCPTVTTQDPAVIRAGLAAIGKAVGDGALKRVHCIHLEANYLSPEEGYRGAHIQRYIKPPDPAEFDSFQEASGGRIGYVTLAPEAGGALEFIRRLAGRGILVGLGHHNASPEVISAAVDAGARLSTHLFNGCASEIDRHRNPILYQLAEDRLWASFIPDGHHVPYQALKVGLRAKGLERSVFTSDLVSLGGSPEGEYTKHEKTVVVEDGAIWIKGTRLLSGAWSSLSQGLARATASGIISPADALRLSSLNPARLLGIADRIEVLPGSEGPFVLFREDKGALRLEKII